MRLHRHPEPNVLAAAAVAAGGLLRQHQLLVCMIGWHTGLRLKNQSQLTSYVGVDGGTRIDAGLFQINNKDVCEM